MTEKITGGCLCGAVRYEATESPNEVYACHCRMCQRHTGSAFWIGAKFPDGAFQYSKGKPSTYQSSRIMERSFCQKCGSTVALCYSTPPSADWEPGVGVAVGSLDDPDCVEPRFHYGIESKLNWLHFDQSIPQYRCDDDPELANAFESAEK